MIGRSLSNVTAAGDYPRPTPGGYVMRIESVANNRQSEKIEICLEFADGEFSGYCKQFKDRLGWWPAKCSKSYTDRALPFFRAFIEAVISCNADTTGLVIGDFEDVDETKLVGKLIGVVVGEREYDGNDGIRKTALDWYNAKFTGIEDIRSGNYTIPEKRIAEQAPPVRVVNMTNLEPIKEDDVPF